MRGMPQRRLLRLITQQIPTLMRTRGDLACYGGSSTCKNNRKLLRCQATTVSALTIRRTDFPSVNRICRTGVSHEIKVEQA